MSVQILNTGLLYIIQVLEVVNVKAYDDNEKPFFTQKEEWHPKQMFPNKEACLQSYEELLKDHPSVTFRVVENREEKKQDGELRKRWVEISDTVIRSSDELRFPLERLSFKEARA